MMAGVLAERRCAANRDADPSASSLNDKVPDVVRKEVQRNTSLSSSNSHAIPARRASRMESLPASEGEQQPASPRATAVCHALTREPSKVESASDADRLTDYWDFLRKGRPPMCLPPAPTPVVPASGLAPQHALLRSSTGLPATADDVTTLEQLCTLSHGAGAGRTLDLRGRTLTSRALKPCHLAALERLCKLHPHNGGRFRAWEFAIGGRGTVVRNGTLVLPEGYALVLERSGVRLEGVTIRGTGVQSSSLARNAVLIDRGPSEAALVDCVLESVSIVLRGVCQLSLTKCSVRGAAVGLHVAGGPGVAQTRPAAVLRNCTFDGCGAAVLVTGHGNVVMRDSCLLASRAGSGLRLEAGASAHALRCRIAGNKKHGVRVKGVAEARLDACIVEGNARRNIRSGFRSHVTLKKG